MSEILDEMLKDLKGIKEDIIRIGKERNILRKQVQELRKNSQRKNKIINEDITKDMTKVKEGIVELVRERDLLKKKVKELELMLENNSFGCDMCGEVMTKKKKNCMGCNIVLKKIRERRTSLELEKELESKSNSNIKI